MKRNLFTVIIIIAVSMMLLAACPGSKTDTSAGTGKKVDLSTFDIENRVTQSTLSNKIMEIIDKKISTWLNDPVLVDMIKKFNNDNATRTLAAVKVTDDLWKKTKGTDPSFSIFLLNVSSDRLKAIQNESGGVFNEIFIMDYQGGLVGTSNVTSDYWQGDEDKFIQSYNGGKGKVFIDKVEFDESSKKNSVQVSVPITDGGKVIGAVTVGIDVDKM